MVAGCSRLYGQRHKYETLKSAPMKLLPILLFLGLFNLQDVASRRTTATASLAADAVGSGENTSGETLIFTINPTQSNAGVYVATYSYLETTGSNVASVDVKGSAASVIYQFTTGTDRVELWFADSVSSGSGNVTITKGSSSDECAAAALAVININLETPNGTAGHETALDAYPVDTVASATGELVINCVGYYNKTLTAGTGESIRINNDNGAAQGSVAIITKAGAPSTVFADALSGAYTWWSIGVGAKP
jgi:hypothetical protein